MVASREYVAQHGSAEASEGSAGVIPASAPGFGSGAMLDWEFERRAASSKVSPPAKLIATYLGLALRAVHDGTGFWLTFEGYVRYGIDSQARWSACSTTGARRFRDRFCTTRAARQPPPALAAFVAFVAEWRKRNWRGGE